MKAKRKRYCPNCSERISRSAKRCHNCGARTFLLRYYAVIVLLGIATISLIFRLLA